MGRWSSACFSSADPGRTSRADPGPPLGPRVTTELVPLLFPYRASRVLLFMLLSTACTQAQAAGPPQSDAPVLMRFPNTSRDRIAFVAADQLWTAPRTGGRATALTTDPSRKMLPRFSPDGRWIAFTAVHGSTADVEVIPAEGGAARRLTYTSLPGMARGAPDNMVVGWTPDGRSVVFLSRRASWNRWLERPSAVPVAGGMPTPLPVDQSGFLSFGPDGHKMALNRVMRDFEPWKRYVGGQAQAISVYDPDTRRLRMITHWKGTNAQPMWAGDRIYFLSDRDRARRENIWVYDLHGGQTRQVTHFTDFDVDFPSLGSGAISFQEGGRLWRLDLPDEQLHALDVDVPVDPGATSQRMVAAEPSLRDLDGFQYPSSFKLVDFGLSPDGSRAAFSAHGDIVLAPTGTGVPQDLTNSSGADEDHPAFSPDGRSIAYTTDVTGEQQVALRPAAGGPERILTRFEHGVLYLPVWSPAGTRLAVADGSHNLWLLEAAGGASLVAHDPVQEIRDPSFSPDGCWIAFSTRRASGTASIHLFEIATRRDTVVSDPLESDAKPVFSSDGRFLLFVSDRRSAVVQSDLDRSFVTTFSTGLYAAVLRRDDAAPVAAGGRAAAPPSGDPSAPAFRIDLDGLMRRVVPLPAAPGNISDLGVRGTRVFFQLDPVSSVPGPLPGGRSSLHVLDLDAAAPDAVVVDGLSSFAVSGDGRRVMYETEAGGWRIADAAAGGGHGSAALATAGIRVEVDPRKEWREVFESAWRLDRDLFVQGNMDGRDWNAVRTAYESYLPLLRSPYDLDYLLQQLQGELGSSHMVILPAAAAAAPPVAEARSIGADLAADAASGRYRLARIRRGDSSRPAQRSPLAAPGVDAPEGSFLLAIDGTELRTPDDPDRLLAEATGTLTLSLASSPTGPRHDVRIEPLRNELALRQVDWVAANRATVDRLSGKRLGYVYLPDMEAGGVEAMAHDLTAQAGRKGLIVDVRYNRGGFITPWVLQQLQERPRGYFVNRQLGTEPRPAAATVGPKIVLANQYSASDAEQFAFFFRQQGGTVVGSRTQGGVRGIASVWQLMDGTGITVPFNQIYTANGGWVVEGHGVDPDVSVEETPAMALAGRDLQLEAAIRLLMAKIERHARDIPTPPAYPGNSALRMDEGLQAKGVVN